MSSSLPHRGRGGEGSNDTDRPDLDMDADADDEEAVDETGYKAIKDAVLFAIDVSPSMLTLQPQSKDSPTSAALQCAYQLMQQRIISNPKDMMGVLLFGTKQSKFQQSHTPSAVSSTSYQYPHCYLLTDLDIPEAVDVKRLRNLVQGEPEAADILTPSDEQVSMSNVLFCANQIFTTKAPNFSSRRLFLVTDNDNPHTDSKDLRASAVVRAKDLYDLGVVIELFPISKPDSQFDRSKFYDDIVYRNEMADPDAPAPLLSAAKIEPGLDGLTLLQSLLSSINSRGTYKRAQFTNLPLELSPDLKISVKGYIIYKRQVKKSSCLIWLDGETPQIAFGNTTRVASDVGRPVEPTEIRKGFFFGGTNVTFTPEELAELRNFGEPGIRIIGFKDMSLLPIWANVKPTTFIYPSEEEYVGSTQIFSALQQTLVRKNKFALVWYIARRNAGPTIAALLPGPEELSNSGEQTTPPGLWILPLPFADDIRVPPEGLPDIRAPDELINRMRLIIEQLPQKNYEYDPSRYPNPSLQWHYRILQAIALEEDLPEKPKDKTLPAYKQIHQRAGEYVHEWGELLQVLNPDWQPAVAEAKGGAGAKRSGDPLQRVTDEEMRRRFNSGTISQLTVADLKEWLSGKGMAKDKKLRKAELVDEVESYLESKSAVR